MLTALYFLAAGWAEPLEKIQMVKLLFNWIEVVRCVDGQKGENPSKEIVSIRQEALDAFDELSIEYDVVDQLMKKLRKKNDDTKGNRTLPTE
jgi:hypothetical protein